MNKFFKILFLSILIIFCFDINVFAEDNTSTQNNIGLPTTGIDLLHPNDEISYDTSSNGAADFVGGKVYSVINFIMGFAALAVFILVIYGGVTILFSNGKPDSYKVGLNIIKTTSIGLVIILFSYAITRFVIGNVSNITEPVSSSNACDRQCNTAREYCCTDSFFGCIKGQCTTILQGNYCACTGNSPELCLGICTSCPNSTCTVNDRVINYSGYCTPEKTNNTWYCKTR